MSQGLLPDSHRPRLALTVLCTMFTRQRMALSKQTCAEARGSDPDGMHLHDSVDEKLSCTFLDRSGGRALPVQT